MNVPPGVLEALRFQRAAVDRASLRSPLYAALLDVVIADVESGGVCGTVLAAAPPDVDPIPDALVLRFLGAIHRLVLDGRAPALAPWFPTAGGDVVGGDVGAALVGVVEEHRDVLVAQLERGVQTNEVGRCAPLAVGFTAVLRRFGLPLRLLEIGASAGLNLRWDRWRYESGASAWGDEDAPLRFASNYREPFPDLGAPIEAGDAVAGRRGCDRSPIDPTTEEGRRALRSYVWPDQADRHERLAAALEAAEAVDAVVDAADAGAWCEQHLAEHETGATTVLYHSIVWQYLPIDTRRRVTAAVEQAAARASTRAPLAWLRMEPGPELTDAAEVSLRAWPGSGAQEILARSGFHGHPVWSV